MEHVDIMHTATTMVTTKVVLTDEQMEAAREHMQAYFAALNDRLIRGLFPQTPPRPGPVAPFRVIRSLDIT